LGQKRKDKPLHQLKDFDPKQEIEYSWTPPSSWYIDPDFHQAELTRLFHDHWLYLGPAEELKEAGDFVTYERVGQPVVVTRDKDGTLRAFYNVCRHHAACVAAGKGNTDVLTCPYHGWAYRLDGSLRRAPRLGKLENFNVAEFGLNPVHLEVWGGLMWVHFSKPEKSVSETYPGLEQYLTAHDIESLRFAKRREYPLNCNWKVFVDNYLDGGYHVEYLHPDLAAGLDLDNYETVIEQNFSIQRCQTADHDERLGRGAVYAFLYPNVMFNRYGEVLDVNLVLPDGPDRCVVVFDYYFSDRCSKEFIEKALVDSHQVQMEDVDICESVQRGLKSKGYDKGRYAPRIEQGELHFAKLLHSSLSKDA
jgi:phenylpropionate dioxygenase-like ring-hydroxylating dioxygenase large terminal subunit